MTTTGTGTRRPADAAAARGGGRDTTRRTGGTGLPDDTEPTDAADTAADAEAGADLAAGAVVGVAAGDVAGGGSDSGLDDGPESTGGGAGTGERDAGGAEAGAWELAAEPAAAARARGLTRRALREWRVSDPGDVDDVVLIVDELVTNAVVHGAGPVRLALRLRGDRLDGEVGDAAPAEPSGPRNPLAGAAPAEPRVLDWAEAGRGLLLVAALATGYGARPEPSGKTVWFTRRLATGGPRPA
ncbi:ATP-binding protein [Actinomadura sp. KC06]|uniref:ATP-binding protein n=1 Tax=Actinomadura sp. KC06 TaxID=2530369 RepID=UPI001048DFD5|nr:ATP-binding protein [Actinomadura sp. KC06]TDD26026.1 ATP-binding protein [Actinomadura sp. KC06]